MKFYKIYMLALLLISSCNQIEKASDLLSGLSDRERYKKEENLSDELYAIWNAQLVIALHDSLEIELPYLESGALKPRNFAVYSYQTYLMPGEVLESSIVTDSTITLAFIDYYLKTKDSIQPFEKIKSAPPNAKALRFEAREEGLYKIIFQPEIEANTPFKIKIEKKPTYLFPVLNGENSSIGSYWGDIRDGGNRDHKGIDIFAKKGTPVIAVTPGRVGFTGEKGLGGKQVWLRDRKRNQSLYYAHLDSIMPNLGTVKTGDTLGFVGNTGNARNTLPHLHFGIYTRSRGAIDPLGFVYKTEELEENADLPQNLSNALFIQSDQANLRNKPAAQNSKVLYKASKGERLSVQGKIKDWYHVRNKNNKAYFVHESLVAPTN